MARHRSIGRPRPAPWAVVRRPADADCLALRSNGIAPMITAADTPMTVYSNHGVSDSPAATECELAETDQGHDGRH